MVFGGGGKGGFRPALQEASEHALTCQRALSLSFPICKMGIILAHSFFKIYNQDDYSYDYYNISMAGE